MRITGYRTLTTVHDWGRPVGDANGVIASGADLEKTPSTTENPPGSTAREEETHCDRA